MNNMVAYVVALDDKPIYREGALAVFDSEEAALNYKAEMGKHYFLPYRVVKVIIAEMLPPKEVE